MTSALHTLRAGALLLATLALLAPAGRAARPVGDLEPGGAAAALIERALPSEDLTQIRDGRELFTRVLASEAFSSGQVGPFDVHVLVADGLAKQRAADKLRDDVVEALTPAAELVGRLWPADAEDGGLISGARLPVVLAESEKGESGFVGLVELLDLCEQVGYSGWHPANEVDTPQNRAAEVVRTWEVQLYNLAHETIADRRKGWVEHGVGYYALAFTSNRALRRGAWGLVPPWLANGLIDELDIAAHGRAWVGQESWVRQTPGWFRAGWSGFVPQGQTPPPPVKGPPADLAVTVKKTGDPWLDFDASRTRHWTELRVDLKSEAPASFARAAATESFLPRDRAAARLLLSLLLDQPPGEQSFTALLDREVKTPRDGMPDSEPLPVLFARALGGVAEVDRLEALTSRELLTEIGRDDLAARIERHGGADALELSDHREQSLWLSRQRVSGDARAALFNAFLEVEYAQQMAEWQVMAPRLDAALAAALGAARSYPKRERDAAKVGAAFRDGLAAELVADGGEEERGGRRGRSRRRR